MKNKLHLIYENKMFFVESIVLESFNIHEFSLNMCFILLPVLWMQYPVVI